jgi:hypothetical protein
MKSLQTLNITCIDNLVVESQRLLSELHPVKIIVRAQDAQGNKNNVTLHQESQYVFMTPHDDKQHRLLYGNWEEALHATKRKIALCQPKTVAIDHYTI